jgi:general secretion pathway protein G
MEATRLGGHEEPRAIPDCHQRGFTLLEVLMVVFLIGTLSAIAVPQYLQAHARGLSLSAIADIHFIEDRIEVYKLEEGELPDTLAQVGADHLRDPWGNPYQYLRIAGASDALGQRRKDHFLVPVNSDYDLYSMGPDGFSSPPFTAKASRDDIVRTSDGGYIGPVSGY